MGGEWGLETIASFFPHLQGKKVMGTTSRHGEVGGIGAYSRRHAHWIFCMSKPRVFVNRSGEVLIPYSYMNIKKVHIY